MTREHKDRAAALEKMQAICSRAEKCQFDIEQKLHDYPLSNEDRDWIIQKLREEKFIDDERFAGFFVKDKFRINRWGKLKIRQALKMKHIREDIIVKKLEEIDEADYNDFLMEILDKKNRELKDTNIYNRKGKLYRFAAQRGFESEKVYTAIDLLLS